MKKIIIMIGFVVSGAIVGCKKEEIETCNCGIILSDDAKDYSVIVKNSCSGNEKKFYFSSSDWMDANPGEETCINNVTNW